MACFFLSSSSLSLSIPRLPKSTNLSTLGFTNRTNQTVSTLHKPLSSPIRTQLAIRFHPNLPSQLKISISHDRGPSLLRIFSQKAAVFIVGSLLFLGRFNMKPALAVVDAPKSSFSEKAKEDDGTYVKILERNPNDVEALKVALYGEMKKGKTAEAVKYVERLIELEPEEVEWRLLEALSYELMGDLGRAKKLFREILKERPLLLRALHGLALAMHKNREGYAVYEMLNKALQLARRENRVTEERNIKILIAQMHVVKGELEGALELFQDLANEDPRDFRPHLCQGIVYSLLDRKKEADEEFEIYRNLIPEEYPHRGFINDVILAAKTVSRTASERVSISVLL